MPNKVLTPLRGEPVLWHVVTRLLQCNRVDAIAVATSIEPGDDPIAVFCGQNNVTCIRGPEDDVLARYLTAARQTAADIVVRVTGDAPLVDPGLIDRMIDGMIAAGADFCVVDPSVTLIDEGFSPFTMSALEKLAEQAGGDPVAKEHVTAYFKKHPTFVKTAVISADPTHVFSGARISVDTPADLMFLEAVYDALEAPAGTASIPDVVRVLKEQPQLLEINAHVHQRRADEAPRRCLIRCDGGVALGMGHVVRCLALADALRELHGFGVRFVMGGDPTGMVAVHDAGYGLETCHLPHQVRFLDRLVEEREVDALVLDVRDELPAAAVTRWSEQGVLTIVLDDLSDRRLAADLSFYPPVPQVQQADWKGARGERFCGWKWCVLRRQFAAQHLRTPSEPPTVLVTMGASDPTGMTLTVLDGLLALDMPIRILVVVGQAFPHREALHRVLLENGHVKVKTSVDDMAGLMGTADLAVAAFGVTAYELASQGVPAVHICLTPDHRQSASVFEKGGMARCLGLAEDVSAGSVQEIVRRLLCDRGMLSRMSARAAARVDGKGAERIAALIKERLAQRTTHVT